MWKYYCHKICCNNFRYKIRCTIFICGFVGYANSNILETFSIVGNNHYQAATLSRYSFRHLLKSFIPRYEANDGSRHTHLLVCVQIKCPCINTLLGTHIFWRPSAVCVMTMRVYSVYVHIYQWRPASRLTCKHYFYWDGSSFTNWVQNYFLMSFIRDDYPYDMDQTSSPFKSCYL